MQAFDYARPHSLAEALKMLSTDRDAAVVLAGGTDLLSLMKDNVIAPKRLVSLKSIEELHRVEHNGHGLRLGALVTLDTLSTHPVIAQHYPGLAEAALGVSSPQIRNMGTVGGDLCQRPRCWYFRGGYGLLALDQGKALVPDGDNRYHAILGNHGPAYFVNPSSLAPILMALDAKVRVQGPKTSRAVPVAEFFRTPTSATEYENVVAANEIVTEVLIPAPAAGSHQAVYEVRQKEALDWPLAAAAVHVHLAGNKVTAARIVLGHVAPTPWRAEAAEQMLVGKAVNEDVATAVGRAAVMGASPLSRNAYKVQLARVAVKRALLRATGQLAVPKA
ncbi:MAG: FAD binding domain-containing protein [Terriglobales bacterium]